MCRKAFAAVLMSIVFLLFWSPALAQFSQQGPKLVGTGAVGDALQGVSVSLSADGNTAIVGGPYDNGQGAAWVWTRSAGVWIQQGTKLVGSGAVGAANQGMSVSLSADGNTAIVGGWLDNSSAGAAWVWTRSAGVWTQQGTKLVGSGAVGAAEQGQSVSLSADGNTAIVGGILDNGEAGAAWVWTRTAGVWTQQGTKLVGSGAVWGANQGRSVSLSADGNTAIVGGRADNSSAGAAWVWTRSAGVWTQQGTKLVGSGAVGAAHQGASVSLSADGNTAIVGGFFDNGEAGAAWVWTRSAGVWTQQGTKLVGSGAVGIADQGESVSLSADGNTAIVGGDYDNGEAGAAWVWTRSAGVWTQQGTKLVGSGAVGIAYQGLSVSLSADGNTAIVGGYADNSNAGAAWVYTASAPAQGVPWAWGANGGGQLGNGTNTGSNIPVQVSAITGVTAMAGGFDHSLALKNDGTVWAWGANSWGQLGNGTNTGSNIPVQVSNLTGVTAIAGGGYHSLALKNDGTVWAWGRNIDGQLGNGTNTDSNIPVHVSNLTGVTAIAGSERHSLALKNDGTVWAWGYNGNGQLGDGTWNTSNVPVPVSGLTGITALAGGVQHSLALKNDGTVWAWGANSWGQLGNVTNTGSNIPVHVSNLTGVTAIAGGRWHSLALKNDGTVWAWGRNIYGQLGNGTNTDSNVPVQVSAITGVTAITGSWTHSLALKNDGTVWAWGRNGDGQLGNGTYTNSNVPVHVSATTGVAAIAGGESHSLAIAGGVTSCSLTCTATVPTTGTAGSAVSFSATATLTNCTGSPAFSWSFSDGTSSTEQNPSKVYSSAGTYTWSLTVTADGQTCSQSGTITVSTSCTLSCTATVPPAGTMGNAVAFASTATPSNCTGTPTFDWNFGDGPAHSTSQNPSHTYASAGTYNWSLTVAINGVNCQHAGSIAVTNSTAPPVISLMKKVAPPFKIVVMGSNLQNGIQVFIGSDTTPWSPVVWKKWKKTTKVIIGGGKALKAKAPKGVTTTFRFVNPDGGSTTTTWSW